MDSLGFDLTNCESGRSFDVGRDDDNTFVIALKSVSRRHASLKVRSDGRVEIRDHGSSFGTFLNNARIQAGLIKDGDTVRFGNSHPFRFNAMRLVECPDLVGISICFEGLSLNLGGRTILRNINAEIQADEFVGILGPSGSGKSSLLACLSGVYPPCEGRIIYDGNQDLHSNLAYLLEKTGVVPQKDLVFDELTVRENLEFSASIKKPEANKSDVTGLVNEALEAVGLLEHSEKQVHVLSGGQRKRVNVAIELLQRPRLLLLDEPTSGLDPDMEVRLFDKLGGLSRRGMTVICVAHTNNFRFFDKLIYLRPGPDGASMIAFCGAPGDFEKLGMKSADLSRDETGPKPTANRMRQTPPIIPREDLECQNLLSQTKTVFQRTLLCLLRDRQSVCLAAALPLAVSVMIVLSQKDQSSPAHICFFMVVSAFWMGMTAGVREIVKERKLYIRDKLSNLIPAAYFAGKSGFACLVALVQAVLLFVATGIVLAVTLRTSKDLQIVCHKLVLTSVLISFVPLAVSAVGGALAGIMVSTFTRTERMAITALPLILLPQILLSRIAHGDGNAHYSMPPFGSVLSFPSDGFLNGLLYFISLGFVTRPCSMSMALCFETSAKGRYFAAEWLYMLILFLLIFTVAALGFLWREKKWTDWR